MNDQPSENKDPAERMRRLIQSGEDEDQQNIQPVPPEEPVAEEPAAPAGAEDASSAPPAEGADAELDTQALSRHPTGEPDATGGWFGEDLETGNPQQPPQNDDSTQAVSRHPTGRPEQTGGWYGQADQPAPESPKPDEPRPLPDQARPTSRRSVERTHPTPPRRPYEQSTIPSRPGGAPLPRHVDQTDPQATRVTPAAYDSQRTRRAPASSQPVWTGRQAPAGRPPVPPTPPATTARSRGFSWGCLLRLAVGLLFAGVLGLVLVISFLVIQYFSIASSLPSVDDLRQRASQFETTRILDRDGNVLYEIIDPNAGRRTYVPLERISPELIAATIATEDKDFYTHPGYDPLGIVRALWQNYTSSEIVSGASTITQQLARTLLLSPEERQERNVQRKAREIVLAAEITRQYTKEEILELYLNENYYGKMAYGIEAAAETYFQTTSDKLTLGQSAFLAGLPQGPGIYDIETNRPATLERFRQVLVLMYQLSAERDCIYVSTSQDRVCVDADQAAQAVNELLNYNFTPSVASMRYPHWVEYIRAQLEAKFDPQTIYRSGFTVFTTLDPALQDQAQETVSSQVQSLADLHVTDGALVAIRPSTGEILAMVGSADFYNEAISGQVNMSVQPRQPGSAIKPLNYVAAFEKGWTPATLIWDVPTGFPPSGDPNDPREPYRPENYDGRFHGPVTVRTALANSFNIPAVKTLQFVGIYDDPNTPNPDGLVNFAKRLGITTLTRPDYGLSLTLGGGDVTLLELTSAFSTFANGGRRIPPVAITRIVDHEGNLIYDYQVPQVEQTVRPEHAYLISSILSDNQARAPMFGANSVLNLPFQVAAKTGTTNDFRDNWTVGYTPDLATGVWVGNADYTPMQNTTGLTGAAPIWSTFMQSAVPQVSNGSPTSFVRPAGVIDRVICAVSGTEPSEWCPEQRTEVFAYDQMPLPKEQDLWQKINIDTWTGLKASAACSDFSKEEFVLNVKDESARDWIRNTDEGRGWAQSAGFGENVVFAPERDCSMEDSRPTIVFANLQDGQTITENPVDIYVVANATSDFRQFRVEYGLGDDPQEWTVIKDGITNQYQNPELIATWDVSEIPAGRVTLRIVMDSTRDTSAEKTINLNMQVPTPTPTITPTPTNTVTPMPTGTTAPSPTVTRTPAPLSTVTPGSTP